MGQFIQTQPVPSRAASVQVRGAALCALLPADRPLPAAPMPEPHGTHACQANAAIPFATHQRRCRRCCSLHEAWLTGHDDRSLQEGRCWIESNRINRSPMGGQAAGAPAAAPPGTAYNRGGTFRRSQRAAARGAVGERGSVVRYRRGGPEEGQGREQCWAMRCAARAAGRRMRCGMATRLMGGMWRSGCCRKVRG